MSSNRQSTAVQQRLSERTKASKGRQAQRRQARAAKRYGYAVAERAYLSILSEQSVNR